MLCYADHAEQSLTRPNSSILGFYLVIAVTSLYHCRLCLLSVAQYNFLFHSAFNNTVRPALSKHHLLSVRQLESQNVLPTFTDRFRHLRFLNKKGNWVAVKTASRSVLLLSNFKQNIPNTPSASKHCVDRRHAISGGLDLHEEIWLHQTGSGLEKKKNRNIFLFGCKSYSVMGRRTKRQPKFQMQNLRKRVKATIKRLWTKCIRL